MRARENTPRRQVIRLLTRTLIVSATVFSSTPTLRGGDRPEYAVQKIQPDLLKDAGAVYRLHEISFHVKDDHRAVERVTEVITILNKDHRGQGGLVIGYGKFLKITDLDGILYDADGNKIRTLGKEDIEDYSAISNYSLYEEARVRATRLYHDLYPYTVELTYELTYDGYLNWPTWYAQPSYQPVEESRFEVTLPKDMPLRHWTNDDSLQFSANTEGSKTTYTWHASMLPKIPDDLKNENWEDLTSIVRIAPTQFTIESSSGDLSSWKSLGEWCYKLYAGRDQLPLSAIQEVDSLVRGIENPKDKARSLYRYLQSRTRYVNITLGIGGWQPFDATYVHEHGYGDCKALSNYMVSLLKRAGVTAYPVLIRNGTFEPPLLTDFPSNQFNHVIACVPLPKDTVWLECTSQSKPFGRISQTNENRDALMITDQGGLVVHVPASSSQQNFQRRMAHVALNGAGTAEASVVTRVGGDQQDDVRLALADATPIEREQWITNEVSLPSMKLVHYSLQGLETREDVVSLSMQLLLPRYGSASGERIFFNPNLMERRTFVPPERSQKRSPVRFAYPYIVTDSVEYRIPRNFKCEALPSPTSLKASFGTFSSKISCMSDTLIVFNRTLEITAPEVTPDQHAEYRSFFAGVVKADRGQVVLVRK